MGTRKARKSGRGRKRTTARRTASGLLTLGELARRAGVSIPTAQTYKRKYQNRLPSIGSGRKQRYKPAAIAVFQRIRAENAQRRGRRAGRPAGSAASSAGSARAAGALSLAEIARRTKISYPTLLRYLQIHGRKIPAIGKGRTRRFPARAVQVFEQLRSQSRGGRRRVLCGGPGRSAVGTDAALSARIRRIESMQEDLTRQLSDVVRMLKQPLTLTVRPQ
jgi:DNA-binding CsgD family transcriptional regulator